MTFLEDRRTIWVVAVIGLGLAAATNLPWHLDDYDQAKQAFVSFEAVTNNAWFFQHTSDGQIATKPPLAGWISAAFYFVTRNWDVAWRIPSLLAAVLLAVAVYRAGGRAFGAFGGTMAFAALVLNMMTLRLATLVRTDMLQAFAIFLIGVLILEKIRQGRGWSGRDRSWLFCFLTAALLIKGPIVYAFILPGLVAFQWFGKRGPDSTAWSGWWPWLASLGIFLLWAYGGIQFVPGFYEQVVQREFLGRFGDTVHRAQPLYFYIPHLLHKFAPWSLLMILLGVLQMRAVRFRGAVRAISPEVLWLVCWVLGGLIVMSIIPSKRVDRIFPVVPPLCLLLAAQLRDVERIKAWVRSVAAAVLLFAVLYSAGYSGWKVFNGYRDDRAALARFGAEARRLARSGNLRLEGIGRNDEGLPLYLQRPGFISREQAVADWSGGRLDAVAVPLNQLAAIMEELPGAKLVLESGERRNLRRPRYVLLTR